MVFDKTKEYLEYIKKNLLNGYNDNKSALTSDFNNMLINKQEKNEEMFQESFVHYKLILKQYAELAKKLGLENSLEVCMLFSYLLWNGYFSISKENFYTSNGLHNIEGAHCFDVMNGKGVCINFSDMLKDFLIECGYNAANLINVYDEKHVVDYKPKIRRRSIKSNTNNKNQDNILFALKKYKYGTHMFTLVQEGKYLYAYDATNLLLLDIKNINLAKLVNGNGTFKLKPYISYASNLPVQSRHLLKRFYNKKTFINPYDNEYFKELFDELVKHLNKNKPALDAYYNSVKENIRFVSNSLETSNEIKTK